LYLVAADKRLISKTYFAVVHEIATVANMSAAYPYLHSLRKGDLTELADASNLAK
jgi:hypothetical protein